MAELAMFNSEFISNGNYGKRRAVKRGLWRPGNHDALRLPDPGKQGGIEVGPG